MNVTDRTAAGQSDPLPIGAYTAQAGARLFSALGVTAARMRATVGSPGALRDLCAEAGVPEAVAGPMLRAIADAMDKQPSGGAR